MQSISISFIICSRNDNYMGDPMWRLSKTINYLSKNVFELGRHEQVEIIIADWGSEQPIADVVKLTKGDF